MPLCDIPPMHGAPPVSLHYVVEGRGPRRILFVMGLGATLDGWMFQHAHFGKRHPDKYTVCVFDNRGIGESDYNSTVNSTSIMANDALALLNHLGWHSDVHLVGISMGGMISMEAASRAPEVFASLTLVNTHAGEWRPTPLATSALFLRSMTAKDTTSRLEALFRLLHSHRLDPKGQRGKAIIEALRMRIAKGRPSRFGFLGQLGAVFRHSVSARRLAALKATGLPVLICVGTDDILVRPQRSHDLHRHLGGVLRVFDGVGHALVSEAHDTFNTVLEDHVRAHDPADVHGVRPVARVPNFDTLPAIDSLFLMMESPENSMSIAGVSMFDSKDAPSHAELITLLHKWTHQFPRLRQRVINWQADASSSASGPLSWVDDPTFDITRHVKVISVTPESRLTVQEAIGRELSRPLLRDRPLWNAVLFDGVPLAGVTAADGKTVYGAEARGTALFIQLHHAIADGGLSVHMILALCQDSSTAASSAAASASGTTSTHPHKADSADNFGSTAPLAVHLQKHDPHQPITRADPALVSRTSAAESHARVVEPKMQRKRHYAQLPALRSLYLLASSVWALLIGIIAWLVSAVGVGIKMLGVNRLGQSPLLYMDGTPRSNASLSSVIATSQQRLNAALDWLSRGESVWSVMNALRGHSGVDVLRRLSQHAQFARV
ncbi:hypothetical protein CAOG_002821 [Capsaspora owczarzaki ATCC 30864]|uniref:Uncharacterized protein n=2 Tax=Capsaspora owczarzaki (strain ATCC 30864) TaxID=595528 RepID=A0A0D2U9H6_CAPO3|nr:hypothetical protein CAOG_002821 [Capsaspora owczarzaki ATCC 30864]